MGAGLNAYFLDDRGSTIRWFETAGAGPGVVYLPGISFGAVENFLATVTAAPLAGRKAILIDYLGSGASDLAADGRYDLEAHVGAVAAVIEAIAAGPLPVVGHSMGGTVGIGLAAARPDLVTALVVGEGNVVGGGGGHSRRIAGQSLGQFVSSGFQAFLSEIAADGDAGNPAQAAIAHSWRRANAVGLHGNARMLVTLENAFYDSFLALTCPRLFMYGARSHPQATGRVIPDAPEPGPLEAAGIRTATLADAGHLLCLENPVGFATIVAEFLSEAN